MTVHTLHAGFSPVVDFDDEHAFAALKRDWPRLRPLLEEEAFELQSNLLEATLPASASQHAWSTMIAPTVRCISDGNYELSCRFTWQPEKDPHTVTFYVEDGEPRGSSIDG